MLVFRDISFCERVNSLTACSNSNGDSGMPVSGLSTNSSPHQGTLVSGMTMRGRRGGVDLLSSEAECVCFRARLKDLKLFGLLLSGLELVEVRKIDGVGEISPSGVVGEGTTIGNLLSTMGREMVALSIDCGVFFFPRREVNSGIEKPRLDRLRSSSCTDAAAPSSVPADTPVSSEARSPSDVFARFRRFMAVSHVWLCVAGH